MSRQSRYDELLRLGQLSLIPLAIGVAGVWVLPQSLALGVHQIVLGYAAIIAAYLAGVGAGGILGGNQQSADPLTPGVVAVIVAWSALWLASGAIFYIAPLWRYFLIIGVWIFLLLRDLRAIRRKQLPAWYGPLRMRMTFWVVAALALIMSRLALWNYL